MDSRVVLDTDVLRRLVATLISDSLAQPDPQSVALARIYFYISTPLVVPPVSAEITERGDPEELKWRDFHFNEVSDPNGLYKGCVKEKANAYLESYPDPRDCHVVAEAECAKVEAMLTLRQELIDGLAWRAESIRITTPSNYWQKVQPPHGTPPRTQPDSRNPLSKTDWWKW
jgi:predicted nucleic acid-binding protein